MVITLVMRKKLILLGIFLFLVVAASTGVAFFWYRSIPLQYDTTLVKRGDVIAESLATGKVEAPTKIDLHFKNSGKLVALNAKVAKQIEVGAILAKQESTQLDTQVAEMQADINLQRARLSQLLAGYSKGDITVAQSAVTSGDVLVSNSKKSLENSKQNAVDILRDAYTKSDDAIRNNTDQLFTNAQSSNPQLIFSSVTNSQLKIDVESMRLTLEPLLLSWSNSIDGLSTASDITKTISSSKSNLGVIRTFLDKMALLINNPSNRPSNITQGTWDLWRASIASSRASINVALSNISAAEENMTAKESAIETAKANLETAKQQLAQKQAPTRSTDIAVYQAQIEQAVAAMKKVQTQRNDLVLVAPIKGVVTETNGEVGEIITPNVSAVSILADGNLQIKLNVVEDNIVNVKVGQIAKITLDAVPDKNLLGTVTAIDPAETTISGAIYYQTTVVFNTTEDFVRSGMTANVWIRTAVSTSTLFVPVSAIQRKGNRKLVDVLEGTTLIEKEVATGLKNNVGMIEVTYGLSEGEKVVLGTLKK